MKLHETRYSEESEAAPVQQFEPRDISSPVSLGIKTRAERSGMRRRIGGCRDETERRLQELRRQGVIQPLSATTRFPPGCANRTRYPAGCLNLFQIPSGFRCCRPSGIASCPGAA